MTPSIDNLTHILWDIALCSLIALITVVFDMVFPRWMALCGLPILLCRVGILSQRIEPDAPTSILTRVMRLAVSDLGGMVLAYHRAKWDTLEEERNGVHAQQHVSGMELIDKREPQAVMPMMYFGPGW